MTPAQHLRVCFLGGVSLRLSRAEMMKSCSEASLLICQAEFSVDWEGHEEA